MSLSRDRRWPSALALMALASTPAAAKAPIPSHAAINAAIHPVHDIATMRLWLSRVPPTRAFPPDFDDTLRGSSKILVVEMSTAPDCLPCTDLWSRLMELRGRYGWAVRTITPSDAMLRSGRLGLPWVGHPVAWARAAGDANRLIPIAIGTDRSTNLARNLYLAVKMLAGVRVDVGVRAMAKFTGIVDESD